VKRIAVKRLTIRQLWRLCEKGIFAVPEIQREFVWDPRRASDLIDSIVNQLPIGSLLIWRTGADRKHLLRHAQQILPPHNVRNREIWFLIDGQQRLSVLYRAKFGHEITNDQGRTINFSKLCLSFDDRYDAKFLFVRNPSPRLHVQLVDILSSSWRRRLRHLSQRKQREADKVRNRINSYSVPTIFVETTDVNEVREAFLRINSGGLRISKADRAFSRASRLDLRRLVKEVRGALPAGFDDIDPRTVQVAMAVIMGQKDTSSKAVESVIAKLEREEIENGRVSHRFTRDWKNITVCIQKAVDHLITEIGVPNFSFLPSELMVPVLASFFHSNNLAQPSSKQRREIRKWFWATAVGRRYTGRGYYENIRRDLLFFEHLGRRRQGNFVLRDKIPFDEIRRTDYLSAGSVGAAFFLLLASRRPRYLESGNTIPLDSAAALANRKDKHHIFPKALLTRHGFTAREANSLCNMCYFVAEENQSIGGSSSPARYLDDHRWRRHFPSVMRSHLIPYKKDNALWGKNVRKAYRQFQKERLREVCHAFNNAAGMNLFRRD
jgi:hypothetical protein